MNTNMLRKMYAWLSLTLLRPHQVEQTTISGLGENQAGWKGILGH